MRAVRDEGAEASRVALLNRPHLTLVPSTPTEDTQPSLTARLVLALDDMLSSIKAAHESPEWAAQPFTVQAELSVIRATAERVRGMLR